MNFFGHAVAARWHSDEPRFVLGAMLPDLWARVRHGDVDDQRVAHGVAWHHRTDSAFHSAAAFVALNRLGRRVLMGHGVGRGSAFAAAHVGIELLLDGVLSSDDAAVASYRRALAVASDVGWAKAGDARHVQYVTERLARSPLPFAYNEPAGVAVRVRAILAGRPRLALAAGDFDPVRAWLCAVQPRVQASAATLMDQLRAAIAGME